MCVCVCLSACLPACLPVCPFVCVFADFAQGLRVCVCVRMCFVCVCVSGGAHRTQFADDQLVRGRRGMCNLRSEV